MQETDLIELKNGSFCAGISPATGGALMYWRNGQTDLMRPALPEAVAEKAADKTAMFPLVPY